MFAFAPDCQFLALPKLVSIIKRSFFENVTGYF